MTRSTITSKGQTTIPIEIRRLLGLEPGDKVDFVVAESGVVYLRPANTDVTALKGLLERPGQKRRSVADMNRAIRDRFQRDDRPR